MGNKITIELPESIDDVGVGDTLEVKKVIIEKTKDGTTTKIELEVWRWLKFNMVQELYKVKTKYGKERDKL